ncbi:MAG TPA: C40 family peptidase [Acidimicrobiales bacterium]|nr:C40 family peptidase [Acidimicrobiales bacterium]
MRPPVRLLLLLGAVVAAATTFVGVGAAAWVGVTGGVGLPAGLGAVAPALVPGAPAPTDATVAARAVAWALARLGTPYRWGGEGDGGFDCSGLVQAAFAAAGVHLPRVAQDQYDAGPRLPPGVALDPGDLVFFGSSAHGVDHVGIVVGTGEMVDAPHTGAVVRVEPIWSAGFVGATRPAP